MIGATWRASCGWCGGSSRCRASRGCAQGAASPAKKAKDAAESAWGRPLLVTDLEHVERLFPRRSSQRHGVALARFDQGAGDRRNPAYVSLRDVDFVDPNNLDLTLFPAGHGIT